MKKIAEIPEGIEIRIDGLKVSVKGEKGELERDFTNPLFNKEVKIEKKDGKVEVFSLSEKRKIKSMVGTIKSHIESMVKGVSGGYIYKLKIAYVHFPMTVKVVGSEVHVTNFLGEKSPRKSNIVGDTKVDIKGDEVVVSGIDKEEVGQTAANIETMTRVRRRDRRVFQDSIVITQKG